MNCNNTRDLINLYKKENELIEINEKVDPYLELAEIQRQAVKQRSKALLFTNVKDTKFPVATNLYGSEKRIALALGSKTKELLKNLVLVAENINLPKKELFWKARKTLWRTFAAGTKETKSGPVLDSSLTSLKELPQIVSWPEDGGPFITLPLVHTQSPVTSKDNLGMYRIQLHDDKHCGVHMQIHRGGGFHFHEAETLNQPLPANIYIGGSPALTLAAIAPLPENISELLFASFLMGKKTTLTQTSPRSPLTANRSPLPALSNADFCITGHIIPHKRKPEGPFGDHYGYYSLKHDYPYLKVANIFHQKDAIFPATVVGRPPQEDHFITCYLQELFAPLIKMLMPQVRKVWAFEESGVHTLTVTSVKDRYPREALTTALRLLGEGQLSLSKVLMVTDQDINIKDIKTFLPTLLERMNFERDLFVLSNSSQDTLDYTGPRVNHGSKAIFLGVGDKIRNLPNEFQSDVFPGAVVFCPGVLALSVPAYEENEKRLEELAQNPALSQWPLVFVFDDAKKATKTDQDFLWHAFTRFEPAQDFVPKSKEIKRFHISMTTPLMIDCRLKPWYPKVLESNPEVVQNVSSIIDRHLT